LIGVWQRYALWEASLNEFERARSVFERALEVDYKNQTTWTKYAEMEMKNKFVNHARNIWDRCVTIFPRVDIYWFKYTYMEELVGAIEQARVVFERWMRWEPGDNPWCSYAKFELRQGEIANARNIYERYVRCHPTSRAYLKYARWEEEQQQLIFSRNVYERSLNELHHEEKTEKLLVNFARFEIRCKEYERARVIFMFALETLVDEDTTELKKEYINFEKKYGNKQGIEDAILENRRAHYEEQIKSDPYNYDAWFDYARLEEAEEDIEKVREVYERAIANKPPLAEKRFWRRYIYLWIYYAVFEELVAKDIPRAREVYKACLQIIPHKKFTFGKIWLMAAHLEVRAKDLDASRKILGHGIGLCGKENIFKGYIELELQLGEVERCRAIYNKYLATMPQNCTAWKSFAGLEANVGETARARAIYELAISQPVIDMPEVLWKSYIDFEISEREVDHVRTLYDRLLERTNHVKVWISYAQFELMEGDTENNTNITVARSIFSKAYDSLKQQGLKEERVVLLTAWREAEASSASNGGDISIVDAKLPRKIKMKRMATAPDGTDLGFEEFYDYQFPDDEKKIMGLKILENAMKWKQSMASNDNNENNNNTTSDPFDNFGGAGFKRKAEVLSEDINIDD